MHIYCTTIDTKVQLLSIQEYIFQDVRLRFRGHEEFLEPYD